MDDPETQDNIWLNELEETEPQTPSEIPSLSPMDQQRLSLYILTQRDRPIPSLESMKEFLELPDDVATKQRLEELDEQYEEDLDRLYMAQAEDYMDDAEDRYYSFDETENFPDVQANYSHFRAEGCNPQFEWEYALAHTTSTYNTRLNEITQRHNKNPEKMVEFEFPQSIDDYRAKSKDAQHRVARFLSLESDDQRKMLTEFGWAWRQVVSLKDEFQTNTEFQEEVRALIVEMNVTDPRKR
ncbi:hypothetical protein C8R44DRAFT_888883 [Mycena epipterygia]|nr:hypothetical protein C8R44DRAFT_888883 [Mycena epipterygia]